MCTALLDEYGSGWQLRQLIALRVACSKQGTAIWSFKLLAVKHLSKPTFHTEQGCKLKVKYWQYQEGKLNKETEIPEIHEFWKFKALVDTTVLHWMENCHKCMSMHFQKLVVFSHLNSFSKSLAYLTNYHMHINQVGQNDNAIRHTIASHYNRCWRTCVYKHMVLLSLIIHSPVLPEILQSICWLLLRSPSPLLPLWP